MKGYKGFEKGLICKGKQYAEDTVFEEDEAEICKKGMHFCALPHEVFEHYVPGENHEFAEVEALDDPKTDDGCKFCSKKLRIVKKISVFNMAKISVDAFFEKFDFYGKIARAESLKGTAVAGNWGAANAGYQGAANAGDYGAANVGDYGVANAGDFGAANAGDYGVANAGDWGAAIAREDGRASAGDWGAAIAREDGRASAGKNGIAAILGRNGTVKGQLGALLILTLVDDNGGIIDFKAKRVDGVEIREDTWYGLEDGEFAAVEEANEQKD